MKTCYVLTSTFFLSSFQYKQAQKKIHFKKFADYVAFWATTNKELQSTIDFDKLKHEKRLLADDDLVNVNNESKSWFAVKWQQSYTRGKRLDDHSSIQFYNTTYFSNSAEGVCYVVEIKQVIFFSIVPF